MECLVISLEGLDKFNVNLLFAHQLRNTILILSSLVIIHGTDSLEITKQNFNNIFKYIKSIKSSSSKTDITKEYMCDLLCELNIQTDDENNNSTINKVSNKISSKKFFKSFELINKNNKGQKSINYKLKWLNENFDIKRINNTELNGSLICDLMENLCEKFNTDENPVLDDLLENILLSKLNDISEVIETQFKTKFNKFLDENSKQIINYYDLMDFYIKFHKEEGLINLSESTIASMINLKSSNEYLIKIISLTYDHIELLYRNNRNKYEDLISKFGNNFHHKDDPKNFEELKEHIKLLAKYLKKYFIPIISFKMFNFDSSLSEKVNEFIINKLYYFADNITNFIEKDQKNFQKKIEEYNHILREKESKIINLENAIKDLKNKEREYLNSLEIQKTKYDTFEKYFHSFENENQKKINDSQNKLNELIKENYNLRNKITINTDDYSLNSIKSDYIIVKNKLNEYKNMIINYSNQINLNSSTNIFEKGIKEFNDNLEQIINNNFNELNEYKDKAKNYKNELDETNFEMEKLKMELKEEQQKFNLLNRQLEDEKKKYEELLSLFNDQKYLIQIQEEKMKLQLI